MGIVVAALAGLFGGSCDAQPSAPRSRSRLYLLTIRNALLGWCVVAVILGLSSSLLAWLIGGPAELLVGVGNGLVFGLAGGLAGALAGHPLVTPRCIAPVEAIRWMFPRAISNAASGLVFGVVCGVVVGLALGVAVDLAHALIPVALGLIGGVIFGAFFALFFGLVGGVSGREVDAKIVPNQGIRRSAGTALRMGLAFGCLSGLLVWLFAAAIYQQVQVYDATYGLSYGVLFGLLFGIVGALVYGGYACCSHIALRLVLWRMGALPLDTVTFLEYATERVLLRRVGGGYIFVHRLLQDYFAQLEADRQSHEGVRSHS
jgi:hypothetical protein